MITASTYTMVVVPLVVIALAVGAVLMSNASARRFDAARPAGLGAASHLYGDNLGHSDATPQTVAPFAERDPGSHAVVERSYAGMELGVPVYHKGGRIQEAQAMSEALAAAEREAKIADIEDTLAEAGQRGQRKLQQLG